jgi:hypothetical protein
MAGYPEYMAAKLNQWATEHAGLVECSSTGQEYIIQKMVAPVWYTGDSKVPNRIGEVLP